MAVGYGYAQALSGKCRRCRRYDFIALDFAPDFERLLLGFFFLAADVRDHVIDDFRHCFKGFACA